MPPKENEAARKFVNELITEKESYYMVRGKCTLSYNLSQKVTNFLLDPTEDNKQKLIAGVEELRKYNIINAWYKRMRLEEKNISLIMSIEKDEIRRKALSSEDKPGTVSGENKEKANDWADRVKEKIANYSKKQLG